MKQVVKKFSIFASGLLMVIALVLLEAEQAWAQACPLCKLSLLHSPEGRHLAKAFNDGILFLLAMPYLVGAVMAIVIISVYRKQSKGESHE